MYKNIHAAGEAVRSPVKSPLQPVIRPGAIGGAEPHRSTLAFADALHAKAVQIGKRAPAPWFEQGVTRSRVENLRRPGDAGRESGETSQQDQQCPVELPGRFHTQRPTLSIDSPLPIFSLNVP